MSVEIDLAAGEVRLADVRLREVTDASAVAPGALRMGDGVVLRPLGYAARSSVCAFHADAPSLARAVLEAAADRPCGSTAALEALALHLAGADAAGSLPGFSDVAFVMARVYGWLPDQLARSPARWVDGLAAAALPAAGDAVGDAVGDAAGDGEPDDGWTRYRIGEPGTGDPGTGGTGPSDGGTDPATGGKGRGGGRVEALRDRLAADLLGRASAPLAPGLAAERARTVPVDDVGRPASPAGNGGSAGGPPARPWTPRSAGPPAVAGEEDAGATGAETPSPGPFAGGAAAGGPGSPAGEDPGAPPGSSPPGRSRDSDSPSPLRTVRTGGAGGPAGRPSGRPFGGPATAAPARGPVPADPEGGTAPFTVEGERAAFALRPAGVGGGGGGAADADLRGPGAEAPAAPLLRGVPVPPPRPASPAGRRASGPTDGQPAPGRPAGHAAALPAPADPVAIHGLADRLAAALEDEADLRGLLRW